MRDQNKRVFRAKIANRELLLDNHSFGEREGSRMVDDGSILVTGAAGQLGAACLRFVRVAEVRCVINPLDLRGTSPGANRKRLRDRALRRPSGTAQRRPMAHRKSVWSRCAR